MVCALIAGCGLTAGNTNVVMKVQRGMSQEQVTGLLGNPELRRFCDGVEQWEYNRTNVFGATTTVIIVDFIDGKVVSMDSFKKVQRTTSEEKTHHNRMSRCVIGSVDDREFDEIYREVKNSLFMETELKSAVRNKKLSCAQCIALLSLCTFDREKLKMLEVMRGHIADTNNCRDVVDAFDFVSSKNKAREMLGISR